MGAGGGSAGLVGSINPTLNIVPSAYGGPSNASTGASSLSGSYALNILSPGSNLTAGASGTFLFVIVAVIGIIYLFRG